MEELKKQMQIILTEHDRVTAMGEADNDNHEHEKVWTKEVELLSKDLDTTLAYLDSIESVDDLASLSEVIDNLVSVFDARKDELIACLKRNSDRLHAGLDDYLEGF